jgi:homoserine kinase
VRQVRVRVPATTANLGAGFDVLGLALTLYNEVLLTARASGPALTIVNEGEGTGTLPTDRRHLVFQAVARAFKANRRPLPASLELRLLNRIPLARGLGSSSAAIVGGLVAGNAAAGGRLSTEDLLDLAARMEGHPDNVAPALLGGLTASCMSGGETVSVAWRDKALFKGLAFAVAVPDFELSTRKARAVLPARVSRADAVFNVGRAALFLAALKERRHDLLARALEDRLHQPYRKRLIPGFDAALAAARRAGAFGACLSGAGPCLLAVSPAPQAAAAGRAMQKAFAAKRVSSRLLLLEADLQGARTQP